MKRGEKLYTDASNTINGERQDMYGAPEDSFEFIGFLWGKYLGMGKLRASDVAFMMVQYKLARQMNQDKRDNLVDMAGYLGILDDIQGGELMEPKEE